MQSSCENSHTSMNISMQCLSFCMQYIQVDFRNCSLVLDTNLFEWNRTKLSSRIGRCETAVDFVSKYQELIGYDGAQNLQQQRKLCGPFHIYRKTVTRRYPYQKALWTPQTQPSCRAQLKGGKYVTGIQWMTKFYRKEKVTVMYSLYTCI